MAAAVAAAGGATLEEVAAEARGALAMKASQLSAENAGTAIAAEPPTAPPADAEASILVRNTIGLHARPAARFVETVRGFDAEVRVAKGRRGSAGPRDQPHERRLARSTARRHVARQRFGPRRPARRSPRCRRSPRRASATGSLPGHPRPGRRRQPRQAPAPPPLRPRHAPRRPRPRGRNRAPCCRGSPPRPASPRPRPTICTAHLSLPRGGRRTHPSTSAPVFTRASPPLAARSLATASWWRDARGRPRQRSSTLIWRCSTTRRCSSLRARRSTPAPPPSEPGTTPPRAWPSASLGSIKSCSGSGRRTCSTSVGEWWRR